MQTYKDMLVHVRNKGVLSGDRTGTGTKKVFGYQWRHNMADGFPLLTSKHMSFKIVRQELLWMMRGDTNIKGLNEHGVHIWDEWARPDGELGKIYGHQWRHCGRQEQRGHLPGETIITKGGVDQLYECWHGIKQDPNGRRHIVSAWRPDELKEMQLPPCHVMFQFGVMEDRLNLHMLQRSADLFLGVPYNIAFYALMLEIWANSLEYIPGELVISFVDLHLYNNHWLQVEMQLEQPCRQLPRLIVSAMPGMYPWEYDESCFDLVGYTPGPRITAEVAV